ncbi:siderophore-interacting protein [Rhodococcus rhodnii]|uniref:Siderophore interacting protein n=2 Tax=Rhodococcus rhodnii TaxID=38312 RepID=R7WMJ3_9NOCA|nr:siderophore-interacting protein [Rhodococcus rhodnii]EOM76500.1 siderophore interacting protein [Rhodococcus rhodnii LMG 5362]TXG91939.1 siderophore-interacting protein [Rhodococcus rhodnii]
MARSKYVKPQSRQISRARVVANDRIGPHFVRVTVAGPELATIAPLGYDQWFRMFFPAEGQDRLELPTATSNLWYAQYKLMGKATRPHVRNYTIRELRTAGTGHFGSDPEIEIDFADHGDIGPASSWARSAAVGDEIALLDEGLVFNPVEGTQWHLLVGDESALPAIEGILRSLPGDAVGRAFVEIPHDDDRRDLRELPNVPVTWTVRSGGEPVGAAVQRAVEAADLPSGRAYTFVAGESGMATGVRRHLVGDRGFAKTDISFTGFWREGKAQG